MKRICMIAYSHYPEDPRIRREAEAITGHGDKVDVICLQYKDQDPFEIKNKVGIFRLSTGRYRGTNPAMYMLKYFEFFVAASFKLLLLHLKNPYQIIHIHTMPDFLVFTALIPKLLGCKVILDVHDLVPELYQTKFGLPDSHWMVRLFRVIERCSIGFADRAIAVSKPHLNALLKHGNPEDKFITLINLPDTKLTSNKTNFIWRDRGEFKIIYHGSITGRYGLDRVFHAITCIKDQVEGLEFRIVGVGDELPKLTKLVDELCLGDCVRIQDEILPPEEFIPLILDADIGIVPILDDEFTKIALPVKLLEYVALGKPVICSRTEAIEAYFNDSMVQYCTPGNVEEIAENILLLSRNPDKRELLMKNADKFNRDYNWEQNIRAYFRMTDELIGSNSKAN